MVKLFEVVGTIQTQTQHLITKDELSQWVETVLQPVLQTPTALTMYGRIENWVKEHATTIEQTVKTLRPKED